ncbi:endospore germination permease [Metabacillus herbersteinensis]|uniref:Endospore germination permease n=1 Tax=Metabacillus herbersteinensis TaxID=283816 RepID=A0ABV6GKW0_9BACI
MKSSQIENISLWQLFILIIIFEIGSSVVVGVGSEAKQDAWLAVLIGGMIGLFVVLLYLVMLKKSSNKTLFGIIESCFGKWFSKPIILLYVLYFFYISSRVLRDFSELMVSSIFVHTPLEVISITMILVIIYTLYFGIEVLSRTSEIFFPYVISFTLILGLGILMSGEMKFTNLQPFLAEGVGPIAKSIFPTILTFPFGEMIAFTMIIPAVKNHKLARRVVPFAVIVSAVILSYSTFIQTATLGVQMRARSNFPLLSAAREISLLNFIERVDLLVVFVVMFGIIVKVGIFFYGGLKGLEHIFQKPYRSFALPVGLLIALFSVMVSGNFAEHIEEGIRFVPYYIHMPMQFYLPVLLFVFTLFKFRKKRKVKNE